MTYWQGRCPLTGITDPALLRASHNRVFMQLAGIIQAALQFSLHASNAAVDAHGEAVAVHRELIEALRLRDGATARACSRRMLDLTARDLAVAERKRPLTTTALPSNEC